MKKVMMIVAVIALAAVVTSPAMAYRGMRSVVNSGHQSFYAASRFS